MNTEHKNVSQEINEKWNRKYPHNIHVHLSSKMPLFQSIHTTLIKAQFSQSYYRSKYPCIQIQQRETNEQKIIKFL